MSISPLDGRYAKITAPLQSHFSEFAYLRARVVFEIDYLMTLSHDLQLTRPLTDNEVGYLRGMQDNFSIDEARQIKKLESKTRR